MTLNIKNHFRVLGILFVIALVFATFAFLQDPGCGFFIGLCALYPVFVIYFTVSAFIIMTVITSIGYIIGKAKRWSFTKTYVTSIFTGILILVLYINARNIENFINDTRWSIVRKYEAPPYAKEYLPGYLYHILVKPVGAESKNIQYHVTGFNTYLVIDLHGNVLRKIDLAPYLGDLGDILNYEFSPTGDMISYIGYEELPNNRTQSVLMIRNINTDNIIRVGPVCGVIHKWNGTGTKLAFNDCQDRDNNNEEIHRKAYFDFASNRVVKGELGSFWMWSGDETLLDSPSDVIVSPNGAFRAREGQPTREGSFTGEFNQQVVIEDSSGNTIFSTERSSDYQPILWSPDGTYLLYGNRRDGLYVFDTKTMRDYKVADIDPLDFSWFIPQFYK